MEFIVEADPRGKESVRTANKHAYIPAKTRAFMKVVYDAFIEKLREGPRDYDPSGYIFAKIDAYYPIAKSWPKKKKAAALAGDIYPAKKPDIDNIQKAVFDALTGAAYNDDKQIVRVVVTKRYAAHGFLRIEIGDFRA